MRGTLEFTYRALRADGAVERGTVESESREAVARALTDRGLFPIELRAHETLLPRRMSGDAEEVARGLTLLGELLEAGLPVSRALAALADVAPGGWRACLPSIQAAVRAGDPLSNALSAARLGIPDVALAMVRAGEAAGTLGAAVCRAAEMLESEHQTRVAIRAALAYPAMLALAATASLALLVVVVLPRFAALIRDAGQSLPWTTRVVLDSAAAVRSLAPGVVVVLLAVVVAGAVWLRTDAARERWHGWLLRLPIVGGARMAAATARVTTSVAALLDVGVPLVTALLHGAATAGDAAVRARVRRVRDAVIRGESLAGALQAERALSPLATRLIAVGEQTGRLATLAARAGAIEHVRATQLLRTAVRLLEPALILGFAALVALVAAALLQAVYGVRPL